LYTLANAYVDSAMQPELDNTIIKLCQSIEETIPKTNFVVDNNLDSKEKEKGFLKKVKDSQIKSGAIATLLEQYKSMVNV
jgi:hypothetical protein